MTWHNSLRRRIVVAYLFLAIASSVLFTVIAAVAVEGIEVHLVDDRLKSVAAWASPRSAARLPVGMPAGVIFYHGESIPLSLRGLSPGVQEKVVDGIGLHILAGKDTVGDYVVVDYESDYEKIELLVYSTIAAGILGFLVLSLSIGRYIARRLVNPISALAESVLVKDLDTELPLLSNTDEVGVLARAFAARTTELKQFLVRERMFTGDVSHELRTSLTVISGAAEILAAQTGNQPELLAPANRILRAALEATDCITVLLLLARAPELLDAPENALSPLIRGEMERCQLLLRDKPVALTFEVDNDFSVFARRELLTAAIGNLMRNACQYTQQGCVLVRLTRSAVIVEDTGPGFPEPVRARLFDESPPAVPVEFAGSGLGLALVMRICEHLGATLQVSARPQGGSVVRIDFPGHLTKS